MAIASILVGIVAGITSFLAALILGEGVLAAVGYYVLGGFVASLTLVLLAMIRAYGATAMAAQPVRIALRG